VAQEDSPHRQIWDPQATEWRKILVYGAFSVSQSSVSAVSRYIANQEEHHRKMSFQKEFIAYLKKHKIDYDERYIRE